MKKLSAFLTGSIRPESTVFEILYLFFRLHVGLSIAIGAGFSKVFHKVNEKGPDEWGNLAFGVPAWFVKQVGEIGFTFVSPAFWAHLAVYGEFMGGLLIGFGLLTRLSALQLAFQFFVISYVWYDDPSPVVGMYFQQLYFFAFLMVFAVGDGRFSLATLLKGGWRLPRPGRPAVAACLVLVAGAAQAQGQEGRVSFTVSNASMRTKNLEFKHFEPHTGRRAGYGYTLNALGSHAVNLPAPVRVYGGPNGNRQLLFVVEATDNGKNFSVNKEHHISREQYLEAARQEMAEQAAGHAETDPQQAIAQTAKEKGLKMIAFRIRGTSAFPATAHVRVQLPWDGNKNAQTGFTSALSRTKVQRVDYPVGTKIYLCDGPYWQAGAKPAERLVVTVDERQAGQMVVLPAPGGPAQPAVR